jgi:formylglycine-generating enzyme required for sulfatase activity
MTLVHGIPMALIPHPQGAWLEGINPITNEQWRKGVEPLLADGAKYCLLEPHHRGDLSVRQFADFKDVLDIVGRDNVPKDWDGRDAIVQEVAGRGALSVFQWFPKMSRPGFDGDKQPVVDVSWYHAKGWTMSQGGLYLLTDAQWEWSAQGGEKKLEYATKSGKLVGPDGKKLAHCSVKTGEKTTIDVDDPKYGDGPFGLRHKTGNVWEWAERNHNEEYQYGLRGGSWYDDNPGDLRASFRNYFYGPDDRINSIGFRVGASAPQNFRALTSQPATRDPREITILARILRNELKNNDFSDGDIEALSRALSDPNSRERGVP